jgi:hypothetical protein
MVLVDTAAAAVAAAAVRSLLHFLLYTPEIRVLASVAKWLNS